MVSFRIHSLTTRFVLTLLLSTALPFLAFGWYAREEMERRLEDRVVRVFLPDQAEAAAGEIEAGLRRTRQGCGTVANKLRDALHDDRAETDFAMAVDFSVEIDPDLVLLVDGSGEVVGHRLHPRLDRMTRDRREALLPSDVRETAWFREIRRGELWEDRHLSPYRHNTTDKVSFDPADYSFGMAFAVATSQAGEFGAVYWLMPWTEVQQVLDETAEFLREQAGFGSAEVFVCDETGRFLAHTDRSQYANQRLPASLVGELPRSDRPIERAFVTVDGEDRRAGLAAVEPFPGLRWWVGLHARSSELLATSRQLGDVLLIVTAVTALILVGWSMLASRAILRPVRRLAMATEAVSRGDLSVRVPARGRHEIAELGRAFNKMAEDLDQNARQLAQAERKAAWGEMARQVAHEIKNPLTPMRMSAQLLLKAKALNDDRWPELTERLAKTVLDQTSALSRIASEFRNFAGPPSRVLEDTPADRLLHEVEEFFAAVDESGGVSLKFEAGAPGAVIKVDREELKRTFLNLVHNAIAACGEEGSVVVSSSVEGQQVWFRITDDGSGVPEDVREKLFEPYFTTKSSGTGLGLAICRRSVEAHGGVIELESSVPGRTVFRFTLPLVVARGDAS